MKDLLDDIQKKLKELTPEEDANFTVVKKGTKGPQVKRHFTDQKKVLEAVMEDIPEDEPVDKKDIIYVDSQDHDLEDMPDVLSSDADLTEENEKKPKSQAASLNSTDVMNLANSESSDIMDLVDNLDDKHFGDADDLEEDSDASEDFMLDEDLADDGKGAMSSAEDVQVDDKGFEIPESGPSIVSSGKSPKKKAEQNEIDVFALEEAMNQFSGTQKDFKLDPVKKDSEREPRLKVPETEDDDSFDLEEPTPIDPDKLPGIKTKASKAKPIAPAPPRVEPPAETNFAETMIFKPKTAAVAPSQTKEPPPFSMSTPVPDDDAGKPAALPKQKKQKKSKQKPEKRKTSKLFYIVTGCGMAAILAAIAWLYMPTDAPKPVTPVKINKLIKKTDRPETTGPVSAENVKPLPDHSQSASPAVITAPSKPPVATETAPPPTPEIKTLAPPSVAVAAPQTPPAIPEEQKLIDEIKAFLESWRIAWEKTATASGDIDAYQSFFSEEFKSNGMDKAAFIQDKSVKNKKKQYIRIKMENIQIFQPEEKDQMIVTFLQHYNSSNYSDKGQVTLILQKDAELWKIVQTPSVTPPGKPVKAPVIPPELPPAKSTVEPPPETQPEPEVKTVPQPATQPAASVQNQQAGKLVVPSASGSLPFSIHAGSYQEYKRAFEAASTLIDSGYPAFLAKVNIPDRGDFFRLYIGSYKDQKEAQNDMAGLKKRPGIEEVQIVFREFAVRIGSFPSIELAAKTFDTLLEKGLVSYALRDTQSPDTIRLMVGAFENREEAQKTVEELETAGFTPVVESR